MLLIKYRSVPRGLTESGRSRGRDPISKREEQEALMRVCRRGAHFEATNVRDTAFSYSCAGVRCHSFSAGRPKRPTGRPRAEPKSSNWPYNRCAKFNDPASKKGTC